jgi:type III secretory pathway lipoprotein EscJ
MNPIKRILFLGCMFIILSAMTGCGGQEDVATVPTEIEAIEIASLLNEFKIEAFKIPAGEEGAKQWRVMVKAGEAATANRILRDHGLPRPNQTGRETARGDGLFPSPEDVKQQHLHELETEIERQLWLLPGVLRVKTIVSPAGGDILEFNPSPASASVVIVCQEKEPAFSIEHVRELVAGSVAKLKPENVRVAIATELPRAQMVHNPEEGRSIIHRIAISVIVVLVLAITGLVALSLLRPLPNRSKQAVLAQSGATEKSSADAGQPQTIGL